MTSGSSRKAARRASAKEWTFSPDLPLCDQAVLILMHEFDRILHRQDVFLAGLIDVVDHRRRVVLFPEPVGPVTSTKPFRNVHKFHDGLGKFQVLDAQHLAGDHPENPAGALALHEDVDPEPRQIAQRIDEVGLLSFLEFRLVPFVHQLHEHARFCSWTSGSSPDGAGRRGCA
jgi:hypothetical protein